MQKICDCMRIAENSSRFSVRVMEAMRRMQNDEDEENDLLTSTVEEIVDYIQKNYRDDGDVYTQVRTTLKEICSQGLVSASNEAKQPVQAKIVSRVRHDRVQGNCKPFISFVFSCIYRPVSFIVQIVKLYNILHRSVSMIMYFSQLHRQSFIAWKNL